MSTHNKPVLQVGDKIEVFQMFGGSQVLTVSSVTPQRAKTETCVFKRVLGKNGTAFMVGPSMRGYPLRTGKLLADKQRIKSINHFLAQVKFLEKVKFKDLPIEILDKVVSLIRPDSMLLKTTLKEAELYQLALIRVIDQEGSVL